MSGSEAISSRGLRKSEGCFKSGRMSTALTHIDKLPAIQC